MYYLCGVVVIVLLMHFIDTRALAAEPRSIQNSAKRGVLNNLSGLAGVAAFLSSTTTASASNDADGGTGKRRSKLTTSQQMRLSNVAVSVAAQERDMKGEPSFVSSLVSGAASRASKELILHPIDTVRARLQTDRNMDSNDRSKYLYTDLYNGLVPALVSGVPAGAVFFAVKDSSKKYFRKQQGLDRRTATILSVAAANVPYWLIRNPSEVLKTRQQIDGSVEQQSVSLLSFIQQGEKEELYRGYFPNIGYAYPADVIKFLVYETFVEEVYGGRKLVGVEAAVAGACAGLTAQVLTTPLDVIRTNIMAEANSASFVSSLTEVYKQGGTKALFRGVNPRAARAVGSGAIQFASYEFTQNLLT